MTRLFVLRVLMATTCIAGFGLPSATQAQDGESAQQSDAFDDIIVTARKREERLQDVSAAVSALSAQELNRRFDTDIRTLVNSSPNVIIDDLQQGPGAPAAISIRGIGVADVEKNFDPTTGVVVDGIFIGANSGAMVKVIDLERVEVLRGPQGTVFGRNAIAGAINITRSKPTKEFGGKVRAGYGNFNSVELDGMINFGFNDIVGIKLTGAKRERDGWFTNLVDGKTVGDSDYRSIGATVLVTPTDSLELEYAYEWTDQDEDSPTVLNAAQPGQVFCVVFNQCAQSVRVPQSGDRYDVLINDSVDGTFFKTELHRARLTWSFAENYTFDYIFGKFDTKEVVRQDFDATPITLFHTDRPAVYEQTSHEIRLTRSASDFLNFVVGAYLWDSQYEINLISYIGFLDEFGTPGVPPGAVVPIPQDARQTTDSWAIFAEADLKFAQRFTLTLGGRYTHDKKTAAIRGGLDVPGFDNFNNPEEESWNKFTPKVSLKYQVNDDLMVYGLYSRGLRAGGFNGRPSTVNASILPYDPETVDNFELGFKSEWLDRRLRLNATAFYMKYNDKQEEINQPVQGATGQETVVKNAATADYKGIEIELTARPTDALTITGNLGWLDAQYKRFFADRNADGILDDLSGLKLRRAPKLNFALSGTYEWDMFGGSAWLTGTWHMIGKHELTFYNSPQTRNKAQHLVDASINFQYKDTRFSFFGRNLTKEDGYTVGFDVGGTNGLDGLWTYAAPRPPRTYGFQVVQTF
jgi:iron complex outermembrane recepter protein